ncbi:MAG: squalene/phytoene synthase family protein [Anaerolineales bacterium]
MKIGSEGKEMRHHYQMLRQVSRTFALSIEQLPQPLRDAITIAYLLFRVSDCLEDNPELAREEKADLLRLWADTLDGRREPRSLLQRISALDDSDPEVYVAQRADLILEELQQLPPGLAQPIRQHALESAVGMARWQDHGPYVEDEEALDDYMHQVAGRVGYLLTDVFSWYSPFIRERKEQLMPLSRECGLALQTVNIIRGMRKDYERGWVFVPQSYYEQFGLTRDSLFDPGNIDRSLQVVELLAQKAERHLWGGLSYVMHLPRRFHRIRLACMWPVYFAVGTLAVSRNNAKVILDEAKLGRDQVLRILTTTRLFGWSNHWLHFYYRLLKSPPGERPDHVGNLVQTLTEHPVTN